MIGIKGPEWLATADGAIVSVILLDTWQWTPFVLLVVGAAIASIPDDLLEVAAIDGASRWKTFLYIELPLLMPLLLLTLGIPHAGIAVVAGFDLFAHVWRSGLQHLHLDLLHIYFGFAQL